jgi:hypothetical protein
MLKGNGARRTNMGDDIGTGVRTAPAPNRVTPRLVPMQVGSAIVYVEQVGEPAVVEPDDAIRPVAAPGPREAFENAGEILRECVRVIGDRVETIAEKTRPQEISIEFSLTFEVKGKASIIPVFVTAETGAQTGLKVVAVWKRSDGDGRSP